MSEDHDDYKWVSLVDSFEYDLSPSAISTLTKYAKNQNISETLQKKVNIMFVSRALIKDKNKYLLIRRSPSDTFGGKWELPGGKIEQFEYLESHMIREVYEETGLVVEISEPILIIDSLIMNSGKYAGWTYITMISGTKIIAGKLRLSLEHDAYGWYTKDEILNLDLADYVKVQITKLVGK